MFIHGKNYEKRMFNGWHGCGINQLRLPFLLIKTQTL